MLDIIGEDKAKGFLAESTAKSNNNPAYDCTAGNILGDWGHILIFVAVFALASIIALELIDKDKR